jgi:hypothetical protein
MPPELPPLATPSSTASAKPPSAAASGSAAPSSPRPELEWKAPEAWRFLGSPSMGSTKAHYYALEEATGGGPPEHVNVYVTQVATANGSTPGERVHDLVQHEGETFTRVTSKEVTTRDVSGHPLTVVELAGTRREAASENETVERPDRAQIAVLVPAKVPYRIVIGGRRDLVERCRGSFFEFVDSLRLHED